MGTSWSEIISDHAMVFIDDVRLTDQAAESPARFLRRMSLYMKTRSRYLTVPLRWWIT